MHNAFNNSIETNFSYLDDDDDIVGGNMILRGLNMIPITSTVTPTAKPEVVLALTIVLVILIIFLIISIFLLLYCVLKRQEGRTKRRKREDYERRRRQKMQPKKILSESARKAKISQIAANIDAAVKSAESTLRSSQSKEPLSPTSIPPVAPLPTPKPTPKLSTLPSLSETAVETPSLFVNQIFVKRWHNPWQQVDHEPSDFSYELESNSVNDSIYLRPL
ncbi:unnamed protein product [Onchocerca ochengi]|uniref:Uncharacterized protein n=2 Tax=Onchocerca TaxID=6281 RepID=A0A182EQL7_ONCOC|nr:unnamed protein product [Onchocerca ochengi]